MSFECFRRYPNSFIDSNPSLANSVVAYKRHLFRNMASENSREALGVRNAFSYCRYKVELKGSNPKAILKFNFKRMRL